MAMFLRRAFNPAHIFMMVVAGLLVSPTPALADDGVDDTDTIRVATATGRPLTCEEGGRPCFSLGKKQTFRYLAKAIAVSHNVDIHDVIKSSGWGEEYLDDYFVPRQRYSYSLGDAPVTLARN